jgi:predicted dehydrogenase
MSNRRHRITRRTFLDAAATAAGGAALAGSGVAAQASRTAPSDRIRMALIGSGNRGRGVSSVFVRHQPDVQFVAACDAYRMRQDQAVQQLTDLQKGTKVDGVEDYRRVLERPDVDAVLIATPDHWHSQMVIDAIAAGKDVYVEKPLSNTVERAVQALRAYQGSARVVQIGTQQRSGPLFEEAAKIVHDGQLGKVTHAVIQFPGNGYGTEAEPVAPVPDGLNWELFQGPAPRHPFKAARLRWRGWWDYGGGLITDWGVHLTDVALWYLNAQRVAPVLTTACAQYVNFDNPGRDQSPDAFSVSWQYPGFVMTFTNAVVQDWEFARQGNFFFGPGGSLLIHRAGYEFRPAPGRTAPAAAPQSSSQGAGAPTLLQPRRVPWRENDADATSSTALHTRNFLDCVKSRQKPVSDLEIGFYATLPCLLGVMAVREGKAFKWDETAKKAIAV